MTFRDYVKSLEGRWVTLYSKDVCDHIFEDGETKALFIGRLRVEDDFIVVTDHFNLPTALPFEVIGGVRLRDDGTELEKQQVEFMVGENSA